MSETLERRTRELQEALDFQTATSEVLKIIGRSASDLQPVLESIASTAARLCGADYVHIYKLEPDGNYYLTAASGIDEEYSRPLFGKPFAPDRGSLAARAALERKTVHIPNIPEDPEYTLRIGQQRTGLGVPLMREGTPVGVIVLIRTVVDPFTERQIELVSTFADQAVIAVENARLFKELTESLEYQTAISDVLGIISRSPSNLQPVLESIVATAARLCAADDCHIWQREGDVSYLAASWGPLPVRRPKLIISRNSVVGRAIHDQAAVHVEDLAEAFPVEFPDSRAMKEGGYRTVLAIPLSRRGEAIGAILIRRSEVRPFSERQIRLLETFADQAVIAIENTRLFNELHESLAYQTATNDVLGVISRSPKDVRPVYKAIVDSARRLCEAEFSTAASYDGERLHLAAVDNLSPEELAAYQKVFPRAATRKFVMGRAILARKTVHVDDVNADDDYDPRTLDILQKAGQYRTIMGVPVLRKGVPVGVIGLVRREVRPFTARQVALVETFAEQAVIAVENARLFAEIREKNKQVERQAAELAEWNRTLESRVKEQVDQLGRMSKLTRFLSPKISNLIMSGEADDPLKTRRAEITVVYVDLRGFTAFTETTDPEEVMSVLREYHAELGKAITAHDGTIEHFAGDGAMILFNAPLPTEDHELRAIAMTLQIRDAVALLAESWRKRGFSLGFGAGVAGGYATIGTIGFAERLDYSAIGIVCNLASRLCSEATDGQILISPRVFVKAEDQIEAEAMGELTLKGFHRPVAVYNLLGLRASRVA